MNSFLAGPMIAAFFSTTAPSTADTAYTLDVPRLIDTTAMVADGNGSSQALSSLEGGKAQGDQGAAAMLAGSDAGQGASTMVAGDEAAGGASEMVVKGDLGDGAQTMIGAIDPLAGASPLGWH